MPKYTLTTVRDGRPLRQEALRAVTDEQAQTQAHLRLARCAAGDILILSLAGIERGRCGPKRG